MSQNGQQLGVDHRIRRYIEATERLKDGQYNVEVPIAPADEVGRLGEALSNLAQTLENSYRQLRQLEQITTDINAGLLLDNILEKVYQNFCEIIPYNRIGFSLIDDDSKVVRVKAHWAKSDQAVVRLKKGYSAPLSGSSLEPIIATGQPRILNDLTKYLAEKPSSESTRLIVSEGMRSSLTCPLIANGVPVGFMFFSSIYPDTYAEIHIGIFQQIAGQLSIIVEKGRLISQLAEQKIAIERQNQELRRLDELKNRFLGIAAHDLRGPLGHIQFGTSLILDYKEDLAQAEVDKILGDFLQQTRYMLGLIDDLLDVTRIESGNLELRPEPIDLNAFLTELVERHNSLAGPKGTNIWLEAVPTGAVMADPIRLRQITDNLVSNAVKYSPPGSRVRISVTKLKTEWRFDVEDEGPGIEPEDRQKLFQDFARLSAKPTGGEPSTGLGLAITRRMVEAHSGSIGVDSQPGQGANFWFTLPA